DFDYGVAEEQGDIEIIQTLGDVAGQAVGPGHNLRHSLHFGPFQGQAPGHDKADVPRTEDDGPPAGQKALDVDQALGRPGGVDTRRPGTGDVDGAPGAFPAAHGQDYGPGLDFVHSVGIYRPDHPGFSF